MTTHAAIEALSRALADVTADIDALENEWRTGETWDGRPVIDEEAGYVAGRLFRAREVEAELLHAFRTLSAAGIR